MKQKPRSRTQRKRSSTKSVLRLPEAKAAVLNIFSLGAAIARPILTARNVERRARPILGEHVICAYSLKNVNQNTMIQ